MNEVIRIGPLALNLPILLAFATIAAGVILGGRAARKAGIDAGPALWGIVLAGVLAARIGYVLQWSEPYLREPLSMIDLRDGGWDVGLGAAAAFAVGLFAAHSRPSLRRPLRAAGLSAAIVGLVSAALLAFGTRPAMPVPQLELTTLGGQPAALTGSADAAPRKPLVVNVWATWCPPCKREMPVLAAAQQAHPDVRFVFLNQGETAEAVRRYLVSEELVLENVLLDVERQAARALDVLAMPTTFFFDADGRLVSARVGELSTASLQERLRGIAGPGKSAH